MRDILCTEHGKPTPTPEEDLARGLDVRYVNGILIRDCLCDTCATPLPTGSRAVAVTQPSNRIGEWESEYLIRFHKFTSPCQICEECGLPSGSEVHI
jgi:hypothetical protein